jgi:predicted dehydrogenase
MIKWGIVGLGNMANNFANAIKELKNAKLIAVASKSGIRLKNFSKEHKISDNCLFNNYSDLINSSFIDAVYISTLNNTHTKLIEECVKNKKNILCEKPMGININEVKFTHEKLKNTKIFFNEAIAYRSHPQTIELKKLIDENAIGEIKKIESSFGFKIRKIDKDSRLFNKDLGGGAILDIGCYPVSFFNLFVDKKDEFKFIGIDGTSAITGVDDHAEISLLSKNNIELNAKVSLKENFKNICTVHGTKGTIILPNPWIPPKKSYIEVIKDNSYYKKLINTNKNVYSIQIENVSNRFENNKNKEKDLLVDIDESVRIMKILDEWSQKLFNSLKKIS